MEEKILIIGEVDEISKNFLQKWSKVTSIIAIVCAVMLSWEFECGELVYGGLHLIKLRRGWDFVYNFLSYPDLEDIRGWIWFLIFFVGTISLLIAITLVALYLTNHIRELEVTESSVKGKTIFGKKVVLPLHMVSAYSTRKFLSVIAVHTPSGVTRFSFIKNYREVGKVLSIKINERRDNTAKTSISNVEVK